ncbi:hypothetical protein [Streptomyces atriruber]|uniref:hypothetical protein n=1 Tax=Streptomyces atriruber TaxID=545121 RepID=UPI0006E232AD|nr:hypothetical protein [Streptomyces atriruber]
MDSSVLGALIGLAGVAFGAGATFCGIVYQQRHTTRAASLAQRRSEATQAAQHLLTELLALQQLLRKGAHTSSEEELSEYQHTKLQHHATVQLHAQWLPDAGLRARLTSNALYASIGPQGDQRSHSEIRSDAMLACADSVACIGAFLRSEALPRRSPEIEAVISRWPEGKEFHTYIVSGPPTE